MIGQTLGPYQITAKLGAGGMGEVYRAHDARLERDVAIKVLPVRLSGNEEIRARFEREAKAISSLNHPHICVLHDVGREGDVDYLVMELIEGETLADRLARGPLPTKEVLRIGVQIADALDRAHRAGVVHRDLKPGNVMLTRSGAKLMDFGLARAVGLGGPEGATVAQLSHSPTRAQPLTAEGTILGTFQYMAPEQLEGREADERADLWALGCVLYEMATGTRAFEGTSQASLIADIMHTEPQPVSQVAAVAPPELDRLVSACLAKDPADRVQSAHDLKLQLSWMEDGAATMTGTAAPPLPATRRRPGWIGYLAVALTAAAATALVMALVGRDPVGPSTSGMTQRYILGSADLERTSTPLISLDGTYVLVSVREGASKRIYRRSLATFEMTPLAGTDAGEAPFFSPDGAWLGFVTDDAIKKVPVHGGVAQLVVSYPRPDAGDWGEDGMIYFTPRSGGHDGTTALARVPESGGEVEVLAMLDHEGGDVEAWLPEVLPGGATVLYSVFGSSGSRILAWAGDSARRLVLDDAFCARYVPSGHLLYWSPTSEAVLAAPFDPVGAQLTGGAVPLTEQVDGVFCFDVSRDGKLAYVPLPGGGQGDEVVWLEPGGGSVPATEMRADWTQPRVSPDGRRILLRKAATDCELWMLDVERSTLSRLTHSDDSHHPVWAPDGRSIAFERMNSGQLVTLTVEGPRAMTTIAEGFGRGSPESWSGNLLATTVTGLGTRSDIWIRTLDDSSPPVEFLATQADEGSPRFSPDGRWIVYQSDETGAAQVFLRNYPDSGTVWQVSTEGGAVPIWSRDGGGIYYVADQKMMRVAVTLEPSVKVGIPELLFDGGFSTAGSQDFDLAPDGRFVAIQSAASTGREVRILLNWPQELDRVAGTAH